MMMCLNLSDIAIITVKSIDYRYILYNISKSDIIYLSENSMLDDQGHK